MNRILFVLVVLILTAKNGAAQQVPFYNHYIINPFVYNPAMTGYSGEINVFAVRNQRYMGYGTGAINDYLTAEGEFIIPNSGLGLTVNRQAIGLQQQLAASLSYSYHLKINNFNHLRFGVSGGYLDNRINLSEVNIAHQDDPFLMGMQPNIASYDFNAGLVYEWKDLRVGVSVPQLIGNKVMYSKENTRGYYALARHFMGTVEYDFKFMEDKKLVLTPIGLVRFIPGAPIQYDGILKLDHEKIGWFAAGYKSDYAVQFNLGFHIRNSLHVGYSYEYVINTFKNNFSGVNHEFLLGYTFNYFKETKKTHIIDPRLTEENNRLKIEVEEKDAALKKKDEEMEAEVKRRVEEELKKRLAEEMIKRENQLAEEKENEQEELEDEDVEEEEIREAVGYHFVELDGKDSPNGLYVVAGVYSDIDHAKKKLRRVKDEFPDAYMVINQKMDYRYIVLKYTNDKKEAYKNVQKFRDGYPDKSVWILNYIK